MKLRVVSGMLRGRILTVPQRDLTFRPTRERIRESVAAILTPRIANAVVADLCAGSGMFGFEMISRGAQRAVFVESDHFRCQLIREHAERFGVSMACRIVERDITLFISSCSDRFDIVYYDPPYDDMRLSDAVPRLLRLLSDKGVLVYERRNLKGRRPETPDVDSPQPFDRRTYGETEIYIFRR